MKGVVKGRGEPLLLSLQEFLRPGPGRNFKFLKRKKKKGVTDVSI